VREAGVRKTPTGRLEMVRSSRIAPGAAVVYALSIMKTGRYRHYKGRSYEVLGIALHSETREKMVLYRPLYECPELREEYGEDPWFVRPFAMFNEQVLVDGSAVPRFEYDGPMETPT
jgi:hypothetical protein